MNFDRRTLLTSALASSLAANALLTSGRALALPETDNRLLIVFLRGAYDAANVIIPTGSDFYYQARPTLSIARPDPKNLKSALPLDADWSLHPALVDSIYPLWKQKQVAFVPFAGTDDMSRSHFETQDTIELGQPLNASRNYRSGFMGRLAGLLGGATKPIAFSSQVPIIFHGGAGPIPNLAINTVGKPVFDARQQNIIEDMYRAPGSQSIAPEIAIAQGFAVRAEAFHSVQEEMALAGRGAVTTRGFEVQAQRVAALMRTKFNLAFLDVGGWDTHVNQGNAEGMLANRIADLGRGLAAFARETGPDWSKTTVVVVSEFGRTFRENGSRGTDHGHGSVYWMLGGNVAGGRIVGQQVNITEGTLNQNRDLPVLTDYRALFGGLFQRLYGLSADRLNAVFPAVRPVDLALV